MTFSTIVLVCSVAVLAAGAVPLLEHVRPRGLDFVLRNSPTAQKYLPETMCGGVALLDYNNDGRLDVFFVNGGKLADALPSPPVFGRGEPAYWNRLYRQDAGGTFTDVTEAAGLSRAGEANYGMGVATGDYDNDGYADLYITNYGRNQLYRNNGNGTFTDVTAAAGVAGGGWSVSAAFLDYDNDGLLDLFVSRYLDYKVEANIHCGVPFWSYCRPDKYRGATNLLFRNLGAGRFADVSAAAGLAKLEGKGMGVAVNDYDLDGRPDIFVTNDGMEQYLLHNTGRGGFEERAMEAGTALSDTGSPFAGMGVAFADYDNDGLPDVVIPNLAMEKFALYKNENGSLFRYASLTTGLAELTMRSSGWGVGLQDFDNDGWKELFVSRSHVLDNVEEINGGLRYKESPLLLRLVKDRFNAVDLGPLPAVAGRGAAFGDLDNDGALDTVMAVLGERPMILKGRKNANHWLTLKLAGTRSNRMGLGARVRAGNQWAYATTSGSYLSASDARVHFGLGGQKRVTVEVFWPSGAKQLLDNVAADQILEVREPAK